MGFICLRRFSHPPLSHPSHLVKWLYAVLPKMDHCWHMFSVSLHIYVPHSHYRPAGTSGKNLQRRGKKWPLLSDSQNWSLWKASNISSYLSLFISLPSPFIIFHLCIFLGYVSRKTIFLHVLELGILLSTQNENVFCLKRSFCHKKTLWQKIRKMNYDSQWESQ